MTSGSDNPGAAILRASFCMLGKLGLSAEQMLWSRGVLTWQDYRLRGATLLSRRRHANVLADLDEAETALASEDWRWFAVRLPAGERSRLYPCLAGETWFLDIETTGLSPFKSEITTVALYDGARCRVLVHGRDIEETPVLLDQKTLLVTFNGKAFDLRFLRHRLGWKGGDLHLDLWHEFRARGMSGGLKKIERRLGMAKRTSAVQNGMEAIKLWYQYLAGDGQALRRLVAYNEEDARVLKSLVLYLIEQSMVAYPMGESLVRRAIARNTPRT